MQDPKRSGLPRMRQVGALLFFLGDAVWHWWYNWGLLLPCFGTGLPSASAAHHLPCPLQLAGRCTMLRQGSLSCIAQKEC